MAITMLGTMVEAIIMVGTMVEAITMDGTGADITDGGVSAPAHSR